jgi:hypothetical protein
MNNTDPARIWWEEISGPRSILAEIAESLKEGKSVIINDFQVPWLEKIRFFVAKEFEELHINSLDLDGSTQGEKEPGIFILEKFGQQEDRNSFRSGITPIYKYLKDRKVVYNKLICISNIESSNRLEWVNLITHYKSKDKQEGVFFLEVNNATGENFGQTVSPRVLNVDIRSKISIYDILSFAMLLSSSLLLNAIWKQYISWLAAIIFEKDIESIAAFFNQDLSGLDIAELLARMKNNMLEETLFTHSEWRAQIHIFFPIIEQIRIDFIVKNNSEIKNSLEQNEIIYCQKRILDPYDAEFGPLVYMMGINKLPVSGQDEAEIIFLHDFRNNLAHLNPCEVSGLERVIGIAQRRNIEL